MKSGIKKKHDDGMYMWVHNILRAWEYELMLTFRVRKMYQYDFE